MNELVTKRLFNIYGPERGAGFAGNVWSTDHLSPALTTMGGGNREPLIIVTNPKPITMAKKETKKESKQNKIELPPELQGKKFRIRKLTPRECFRLMGVDDADIDKIQASGLSNSAQYKLAGNSIVVDVLFHIFRKLFIEPEQEVRPGEQFSLF